MCRLSSICGLVAALVLLTACHRVGVGVSYAYYPDHGVYYHERSGTYYWHDDDAWHEAHHWHGPTLGGQYTIHSEFHHPRHDPHFLHHHH